MDNLEELGEMAAYFGLIAAPDPLGRAVVIADRSVAVFSTRRTQQHPIVEFLSLGEGGLSYDSRTLSRTQITTLLREMAARQALERDAAEDPQLVGPWIASLMAAGLESCTRMERLGRVLRPVDALAGRLSRTHPDLLRRVLVWADVEPVRGEAVIRFRLRKRHHIALVTTDGWIKLWRGADQPEEDLGDLRPEWLMAVLAIADGAARVDRLGKDGDEYAAFFDRTLASVLGGAYPASEVMGRLQSHADSTAWSRSIGHVAHANYVHDLECRLAREGQAGSSVLGAGFESIGTLVGDRFREPLAQVSPGIDARCVAGRITVVSGAGCALLNFANGGDLASGWAAVVDEKSSPPLRMRWLVLGEGAANAFASTLILADLARPFPVLRRRLVGDLMATLEREAGHDIVRAHSATTLGISRWPRHRPHWRPRHARRRTRAGDLLAHHDSAVQSLLEVRA